METSFPQAPGSPGADDSLIRAQLRPEERLLWSGRPDPSKHLTSRDAFLIPFSLLWCGFAVFWEWNALHALKSAPIFFPIFGGVFVLVGLYFVVGRFIAKAMGKRRTRYFITDQRALILTGRSWNDVSLRTAHVSTRTSRSGSHGDALFNDSGLPQQRMMRNSGMEAFSGGSSPAFYDVAQPQAMFEALGRAQNQAPAGGAQSHWG